MSSNNACVYKLTFINRIEAETPPYYYIGSKTKYTFVNGIILDKNNNPYYGSSRWKCYKDIVNESVIMTQIIKEFENISTNDLMNEEGKLQREVNAKTSIEYFNLEYANSSNNNNYTNPNYATYKHKDTGKVIRLRRDSEEVLSKEYIGVTSGIKYSEERKKKISEMNSGKDNAFYGKTHKESSKDKISKSNKGKVRTLEVRKKQSEQRKGIPKSDEHKSKIGRKGLVNLKHLDGRSVRVTKSEEKYYKDLGFMNPFALKCYIAKNNII